MRSAALMSWRSVWSHRASPDERAAPSSGPAAVEAAPEPLVGVGRGHLLDLDPVPPFGAEVVAVVQGGTGVGRHPLQHRRILIANLPIPQCRRPVADAVHLEPGQAIPVPAEGPDEQDVTSSPRVVADGTRSRRHTAGRTTPGSP